MIFMLGDLDKIITVTVEINLEVYISAGVYVFNPSIPRFSFESCCFDAMEHLIIISE